MMEDNLIVTTPNNGKRILAILATMCGLVAGAWMVNSVFFADDTQDNIHPIADFECDSPDDNCPVFQSPLELPAGLSNPYVPTSGGTEAVNGHVPPALSTNHDASSRSFNFVYEATLINASHTFTTPLDDDDREIIYNEYHGVATVINMMSVLDGVTELSISNGAIGVVYSEGTDAATLQDQLETVIGHFG